MSKKYQKIVVVGVSASGKSILSRKIFKETGLPLFHMDKIMWNRGWNYIGGKETINALKDISNKNQWIIDGYITKNARSFVFEKADLIIYLDYHPLLLSWRYIKRCIKHFKNPRPELPGSPDKFSWKFLKLVWTKGEAISLDENLNKVISKDKIIILKNPREANKFINSLERI
ncbi:MAG: hypothetical protein US30_C0012G0038 [Candidatus Moranbacteria bacterium GW2011_GWF2_36_839]|nr:MAG: hypothetical protein US27_C0012G0012 [Candidatus Moranbacteria bacterium GW2011_GWF1_36_78]KKQ16728.1 MAG: hypothetical protein US30_C0012G0038 [Candidatus Moranbacteria bacterium GW2011_GWF2_36_839]HAT74241.1 hypothetical protein [Candidatus Moranbacteria bacterium]HBY11391.1 hypothetical protein [Candidatus Moranbacteria bacterium]